MEYAFYVTKRGTEPAGFKTEASARGYAERYGGRVVPASEIGFEYEADPRDPSLLRRVARKAPREARRRRAEAEAPVPRKARKPRKAKRGRGFADPAVRAKALATRRRNLRAAAKAAGEPMPRRRAEAVAPRRAPARRRKAQVIPPHPPSPRGGRKCKDCGKTHTVSDHWSHAKGKRMAKSYKTRRGVGRPEPAEAPRRRKAAKGRGRGFADPAVRAKALATRQRNLRAAAKAAGEPMPRRRRAKAEARAAAPTEARFKVMRGRTVLRDDFRTEGRAANYAEKHGGRVVPIR